MAVWQCTMPKLCIQGCSQLLTPTHLMLLAAKDRAPAPTAELVPTAMTSPMLFSVAAPRHQPCAPSLIRTVRSACGVISDQTVSQDACPQYLTSSLPAMWPDPQSYASPAPAAHTAKSFIFSPNTCPNFGTIAPQERLFRYTVWPAPFSICLHCIALHHNARITTPDFAASNRDLYADLLSARLLCDFWSWHLAVETCNKSLMTTQAFVWYCRQFITHVSGEIAT